MHKYLFSPIALLAVLLWGVSSCSQNTPASNSASQITLPGEARQFVNSYFPDKQITSFVESKSMMDFEITLDDGTEISFNTLGEWEELDFKVSEMPKELAQSLPSTISEYISTSYPGSTIRKIEKIYFGRRNFLYRIMLHKPKNVELRFTKDGENISDNPDLNKLSSVAQAFLSKHFSEVEILSILKDEENGFDVTLSDKTYIYFDRRGNWTEIKGAKQKSLPESFLSSLPKDMQRYIANNYAGQIIRKIEKKSFGYRVRLNKPNNVELNFNDNGMFLSKSAKDSDDESTTTE